MSEHDEKTEADPTKREGPGSPNREVAERAESAPIEELARGTFVGRYVLLDVVGHGGMGIVYAAYDPELDRKIAIKLLQAMPGGSGGGTEQAWLLREAQAMARLAHPNVISVHDVGTLPGDRVFVAMELVDGSTLREWFKKKARTWREVLPLMMAAGGGLAAAHAADLVHRDFKPENVLVGRDGRVRVMDFGLARLQTDHPRSRPSDSSIDKQSPLSANLTMAGSMIGTPAYMAPELRTGGAAGPRSDQFAFGIALYEGLYGARPYKSAELAADTSPPKPKPPASAGVPPRIERVVLRAIALDPNERYPTMDQLLKELGVDPAASRRRVLIGAGSRSLSVSA